MDRGTRQHDHSNHVVHVPETIGSTDNQLNLVVGSLDTSVRKPMGRRRNESLEVSLNLETEFTEGRDSAPLRPSHPLGQGL